MSFNIVPLTLDDEFTAKVENDYFVCNVEAFCDKSEYFESLLCGSFAESATKTVELEFVKLEIFEYVYDWINKPEDLIKIEENSTDFILNLFLFCDRFLIDELRNICQSELSKRLKNNKPNLKHPGHILNVALLLDDAKLKESFEYWVWKYVIQVPRVQNIRKIRHCLFDLEYIKQNPIYRKIRRDIGEQPKSWKILPLKDRKRQYRMIQKDNNKGAEFLSDICWKAGKLMKERLKELKKTEKKFREILFGTKTVVEFDSTLGMEDYIEKCDKRDKLYRFYDRLCY